MYIACSLHYASNSFDPLSVTQFNHVWNSRFDQSFVLSPIAMTFVKDPRNPHWAMPNITKVLKTHVDRYNKVKNKNTIQWEQFPNLIGKSYKLYNETFIVHANTRTSTNQLKHMSYTHGFRRFGHIKLAQLRPFYLKCVYQAMKASGHVYVC
jgi:hypothetical protein